MTQYIAQKFANVFVLVDVLPRNTPELTFENFYRRFLEKLTDDTTHHAEILKSRRTRKFSKHGLLVHLLLLQSL